MTQGVIEFFSLESRRLFSEYSIQANVNGNRLR